MNLELFLTSDLLFWGKFDALFQITKLHLHLCTSARFGAHKAIALL